MDFSKKDDVFTISLPGSDLVFTQYLYIKEEVRIALLVSILNKSDEALFWAHELYNSGFKYELINLIWKIYYDFFATLNPSYETYLIKKHKELMMDKDKSHICLISSIIQDLLFRPFNSDVFMLRNICENFEIDICFHHGTEKITHIEELTLNMTHWVNTTDLRSISQWVLNINKDFIKLLDIYDICINIFDKEQKEDKLIKSKLKKEFISASRININTNIILLAKIVQLFSKKAHLKKGKNIYINVQDHDIALYNPIIGSEEINHFNILEKAYLYGIDDLKHLSLFKLTRQRYNLQEKYWYKWEYHASFSPLWAKRIKQFGGYTDYNKQKVIFKEEPNDDLMQEFYSIYGLEPDEQPVSIQNKSIDFISKVHNWKWFNQQYKKNGLFEIYEEELEEFDKDGLKY
jgi:hypothetical protein